MQRDCRFVPLRLWAGCGLSYPPIRRTKSLLYTPCVPVYEIRLLALGCILERY
jgi:hypothetical protein